MNTWVKRSVLDALHPRHPGPPARHVVRILEQLPDRCGGAAIVRERRAAAIERITARSRSARARRWAASRSRPPRKLSSTRNAQADDLAARAPTTSSHSAAGGAAGGEQVVVDQHARAAGERVGVDLERVDPVLERVLGADRLVGQLARLARGNEAGRELRAPALRRG